MKNQSASFVAGFTPPLFSQGSFTLSKAASFLFPLPARLFRPHFRQLQVCACLPYYRSVVGIKVSWIDEKYLIYTARSEHSEWTKSNQPPALDNFVKNECLLTWNKKECLLRWKKNFTLTNTKQHKAAKLFLWAKLRWQAAKLLKVKFSLLSQLVKIFIILISDVKWLLLLLWCANYNLTNKSNLFLSFLSSVWAVERSALGSCARWIELDFPPTKEADTQSKC